MTVTAQNHLKPVWDDGTGNFLAMTDPADETAEENLRAAVEGYGAVYSGPFHVDPQKPPEGANVSRYRTPLSGRFSN